MSGADAPASGVAARGRSVAVLVSLAAAGTALIGSTQTWLTAAVAESDLPVTGAEATAVLQPLSLAALALGLVLAIVGRVLRYALGAIGIVLGGAICSISLAVAVVPTAAAAASVVTEHTGIAGDEAIEGLVTGIAVTPWPAVTAAAGALVALAGAWTLATAHRWRASGRRYEARVAHAAADEGQPLDAVDSWDDLSRGDDPTR